MSQARGTGSRRGFYLVLLAVAVIGAGAISWAMTRRGGASAVVLPQATPAALASRPPGYVFGSASAPVEIVEYADFECPICGQFATVTEPDVRKQLIESGKARYRFYDFQVRQDHRNSPAASLAAACANDQGKFWEMHDRIFAGQNDWNTQATDRPRPIFEAYAKAIGLDAAKWGQCYDAGTHLSEIAAHGQYALNAGVHATPSFAIGGRMLEGSQPYDVIAAMVDSARTNPAAGGGAAPTATPPAAPTAAPAGR